MAKSLQPLAASRGMSREGVRPVKAENTGVAKSASAGGVKRKAVKEAGNFRLRRANIG
jgi:hypothetical protein